MPWTQAPPYVYTFGDPDRLEIDPLYARLRAHEPVVRVKLPYGDEGWLVTRHEAVKAALGDPRFSRAAAQGDEVPRAFALTNEINVLARYDPPEHSRRRRLVAGAFTDRRTEQRRPWVQKVVDDLLDGVVRQGRPVDLVSGFAMLLPVATICDVLGVPYADHDRFHNWVVPLASTTAYSTAEMRRAWEHIRNYLAGLVSLRRVEPADDVLSMLVRARDEGAQLTEEELVSYGVNLLHGGHEGTTNELANLIYLLLTHPDQLAWLREDLNRVPQAVEELLRFVPLASGAPNAEGRARRARADVELDGVRIPTGDFVLPSIMSANRDEWVFAHPDRLDLTRRDNPHLTFGFGPHHCLGARLARLELQVGITALLARFPALRLAVPADQVPWKSGMLSRGPRELPVTW